MEIKEIISSGILELYCMGMCTAVESDDVKSWTVQYPEVAAEIASIEMGLENYARANAVEPAPGGKEKLFAHINKIPVTDIGNSGKGEQQPIQEAIVRHISPVWKWAAAASIVLLIGTAVTSVLYYNKYNNANNELAGTRELLQQEKSKMNEMKQDMDIVHDPYSKAVSLVGMGQMPDATAKIFWMQNTGEVMIDASNLPDAPAGKQYQFWAIVDGNAVDGGMIVTNDKGIKFRMQKMKTFGKAQAFAISLEKAGGSPTPTAVVSMGKI